MNLLVYYGLLLLMMDANLAIVLMAGKQFVKNTSGYRIKLLSQLIYRFI